ncbi:MAG: CDC27 family protein [Planctomycetota bacterium]
MCRRRSPNRTALPHRLVLAGAGLIAWMVIAAMGCTKSEPSPMKLSSEKVADRSSRPDRIQSDPKPTTAESKIDEADVCGDFVGSSSCRTCHSDRADGFVATDHARSLRLPDPEEEVVLPSWQHEKSRQRFRVVRDGDRVIHQSWQGFPDVEVQLPIADQPIQYVVGSGAFAKSYLLADGPSLMQAPLTYYVGKASYDMSPGYDLPRHPGFQRQVSDQCLFCHVGQIERQAGNSNHTRIIEMAIGCERCHGAGHQHVQTAQVAVSDESTVISPMVHPDKLSRAALEDLCAQCHLQGNVTMHPEGHDAWSYRPGELLTETKIEYLVSADPSETAFVGHFSQMRASQCYQNSESLQCVTCHDPHHEVESSEAANLYRTQCLQCHDDAACGIDHPTRIATNDNQCVVCHMPRGDSEVPHVSITNHRIAVHDRASVGHENRESEVSELAVWPTPIALLDPSPPDSWQRQRNQAVALGIWVLDEASPSQLNVDRIHELIATLRSCCREAPGQRSRNGVVSEAILCVVTAQLIAPDAAWRRRLEPVDPGDVDGLRQEVIRYARRALTLQRKPMLAHRTALYLLATVEFDLGQYANALWHLESLVQLQRSSQDWYHLGLTYARLGRMTEAETALMRAVSVNPSYDRPYASLSKLYATSDPQQASRLSQIFKLLQSRNGS